MGKIKKLIFRWKKTIAFVCTPFVVSSVEQAIAFITLKSNSVLASWSPTSVTNTGTTLDWTVSGAVTIAKTTINDPTFNFSPVGTKNVLIENVNNLTGLYLYILDVVSIDISEASALTSFTCDNNPSLTTLDVSNNTLLTSLGVSNNPSLTTLDVSNNTLLTSLGVSDSILTTLDVSNNTLLTYLGIFNSVSFTTINLTNNTLLDSFTATNCALTTLDISNNTSLTNLEVAGNSLTTLGISTNVLLSTLSCSNNSLTTLDVSNNTLLNNVTVHGNNMASIVTNQILSDLVAHGVNGGTLYIKSNATGQGITDIATLRATPRSWTVIEI